VLLPPAAFTSHPLTGSICVKFLLPDRETSFDFIDDKAAGIKCLSAMRSRNYYHDSTFSNFESARAVRCSRVIKIELFNGLSQDTAPFLLCHRAMGLILQSEHLATLMVIPDQSLED
jgi:hypothetical protein